MMNTTHERLKTATKEDIWKKKTRKSGTNTLRKKEQELLD